MSDEARVECIIRMKTGCDPVAPGVGYRRSSFQHGMLKLDMRGDDASL